jgi:DNA-binding MarR family transcriptional regulator
MQTTTEMLIYEMSLRVRLYIASKELERRVQDLTERESLLIELLGLKEEMSISEIGNLYASASSSTISTTITKLWKDKKLVDKNILPENQRITVVTLTEKGKKILEEIKKRQSLVFKTVAKSLGLSQEENVYFKDILENAIKFFDEKLGL